MKKNEMKKYQVIVKRLLFKANRKQNKLVFDKFIYVYAKNKKTALKDIDKLNQENATRFYKLGGVIK